MNVFINVFVCLSVDLSSFSTPSPVADNAGASVCSGEVVCAVRDIS